jgi:cell division protein FtsB
VLVSPTLLRDAADGREERRRRRQEAPAARVYPLPPRRTPDAGGDRRPATLPAAGDDEHDGAATGGRRRPSLRQVAGAGGTAAGASQGPVSGRGAHRPTPSRPGQRRRARVLGAVGSLSFDRLLPGDDEARARRNQRLRRLGTRVGSAALAVVVVYSVFPVRTYLNQRAATDRAREQLEVFQEENERLEERARDLRDDDTIEQKAREDLGLVMPGEESYGILPAPRAGDPAPTTTTTLPAG